MQIALLQLTTGIDPAKNAATVAAMARDAATRGAEIIFTPEMTGLLDGNRARLLGSVTDADHDRTLGALRAVARECTVWVALGSLAVRTNADTCANRSFLINSCGEIVTTYDKIHLFDVDLPSGERYRESTSYTPGDRAVLANTPWGKLGLTICYDVRFPTLYRTLAKAGASLIAVPAAFTKTTGEAHWHSLLKARAIETGCFIVAAAQSGVHEDGRSTYGHSLVIGPWGESIADGGDAAGIIMAEIDLANVGVARSRIPSLNHDRPYEMCIV